MRMMCKMSKLLHRSDTEMCRISIDQWLHCRISWMRTLIYSTHSDTHSLPIDKTGTGMMTVPSTTCTNYGMMHIAMDHPDTHTDPMGILYCYCHIYTLHSHDQLGQAHTDHMYWLSWSISHILTYMICRHQGQGQQQG